MITDIIREYIFYDIDLKIAVNVLPVKLKMIVVMHLCGYTQQETADHIGYSRAFVSESLKQARTMLGLQLCQH